jgi:hypothetical protein
MKRYTTRPKTIEFIRSVALCAVALSLGTFAASAATVSRSIEVNGAPATVWSAIGAFCAIKDWLPPVGMCIEDGKTPPTRTLVTKDGKASFVEKQTARNESLRRRAPPVRIYDATAANAVDGLYDRHRQLALLHDLMHIVVFVPVGALKPIIVLVAS